MLTTRFEAMSFGGTAMYRELDPSTVPAKVVQAVAAAEKIGFDLCVHPATGRLLQSLGAGIAAGGVVAEIGTGTGAGLGWLSSYANQEVSFVSIEIDEQRASAAREVFADVANVAVLHGDAGELYAKGPFDLLVFDGGWGTGKTGGKMVGLADVVKPHGMFTIDDFTPMTEFPPQFEGAADTGRLAWLNHPDVLATEVQVAPTMSVLLGRHTPGARMSS